MCCKKSRCVFITIGAIIFVFMSGLTSCGKKEPASDNVSETKTAENIGGDYNSEGEEAENPEEESDTENPVYTELSLSQENYCELDDEEYEYFSEVQGFIEILFPEVSGKKVYGCRGVSEIETEEGNFDCLIVDFYTYASENYTKIATVAKPVGYEELYILDGDNFVKADPAGLNE